MTALPDLLPDLQAAGAAGDALRVQEIAAHALLVLSPSGALSDLAARTQASADFDAAAAAFDADEEALNHLDREGLLDQIEDDFARGVPAVEDALVPLENWAIPLLAALAGPFAPLLSFGLLLACKVALSALNAWAKKRVANAPKPSTGSP